MNKTVFSLLTIVIAAGVLGAITWIVKAAQPSSLSVSNPVAEQTENVKADDLSLPAFAQRKLTGSDFAIGRVLEENSIYARHHLTYKSNGLTISGIINIPKGQPPAGGFPVAILNHGHIDTAVYTNGRGLRREQDFFARNGYVVIHSDYRNHAQSDKDGVGDGGDFRFGYTTDVINVINALQSSGLEYIDANRIGMLGHSMGGGITQNILVTYPNLVDAAILYAPVSADVRDNFNKWVRKRPEVAETILNTYGEPETNPKFWDNLSPISFIANIQDPIMIHHGTADRDTDLAWSERFVAALQAQAKDVTFHVYPGEPHEFAAAWSTVMRRSLDFFDQHVKGSI